MINRRQAIKRMGGLAGAATLSKFLAACGSDDGPPPTMVFMMMENRTYDHVFGARKLMGMAGDGLVAGMSNPNVNGVQVPIYEPPVTVEQLCANDPPHSWNPSRAQWNNGANDGFLRVHQEAHANDVNATEPMQYLTRTHQPISWALADAYTTCDRWFASVLGPTLPNRAYWHLGTSVGFTTNDEVLDTFFNASPVPSIYNRLSDNGIDWAYYYGSLPVVSLIGNPGPYQLDVAKHVKQFTKFSDDLFDPNGDFFKDAAAGTLPPVVYIDPFFFLNDDHPPAHPLRGQELIAAVYTALANSPQWDNCMLVITYDEHGGFYDHVSPPQVEDDTEAVYGVQGFNQLGFRVPAMVIGPYVKQNYVSSVDYNHTSALKHISNAFDLEPLTLRAATANDLVDCLDLDRMARKQPNPPIALPSIEFAFTTSDENTGEVTVDGVTYPWTGACKATIDALRFEDPISDWADRHPGAFTREQDLRPHYKAYLRSISDYLRTHRSGKAG